jgi:hypothetical protein
LRHISIELNAQMLDDESESVFDPLVRRKKTSTPFPARNPSLAVPVAAGSSLDTFATREGQSLPRPESKH